MRQGSKERGEMAYDDHFLLYLRFLNKDVIIILLLLLQTIFNNKTNMASLDKQVLVRIPIFSQQF